MPKAKVPVSVDDRRDVLTISPEKVFFIIAQPPTLLRSEFSWSFPPSSSVRLCIYITKVGG